MHMRHWALLLGTLAAGGCGGDGAREGQPADSAGMMGQMDTGGMGMGRMNMPGMAMMPGMQAHMDSMMRMSPREMQAMMAMHQERMSRVMDGMGADMRGMKMAPDPAWNALADSVRRDLADLPRLEGDELAARMRGHADRVRRLLARHEGMMGR